MDHLACSFSVNTVRGLTVEASIDYIPHQTLGGYVVTDVLNG